MALIITRDKKKKDTFDVTIEGETFHLKKFKHLNPEKMRELNKLDDFEAMCMLLEEAAPGLLQTLETQEEMKQVINAWQADSDVTVGES